MAPANVDLAVSIPTFIGSVLSALFTFTVLILHFISPPRRRHVRHALIVNLLLSDFVDMVNNTVTGLLVLKYGTLDQVIPSGGCTMNAWVGQLTVQTTDFNILFISITVLLTVNKNHLLQDSSLRRIVAVCLCAWIPGVITSMSFTRYSRRRKLHTNARLGFTALGLHVYGPVGGNWCWIEKKYPVYRWALSFGWRLLIFFLTVGIYTAIYVKLRRLFGRFRFSDDSTEAVTTARTQTVLSNEDQKGPTEQFVMKTTSFTITHDLEDNRGLASDSSSTAPINDRNDGVDDLNFPSSHNVVVGGGNTEGLKEPDVRTESLRLPAPPNLRRMLLLNGYPLGYLILWTPGIVNRLIEIRGGTLPSWFNALLASSQYIGLVHAVTYGYNEQIGRTLRSWTNFRRKAQRLGEWEIRGSQ
ncbi:G protein-coupled glucose receptor regulating Gpa2-domain-containing protein [Colletotrichum godetiae]|uniref:G protein-coupled glucose receptor regulating Gpa2-domain-containing protein n=1 Tax=Colletotrichum godetiae TaxID=1209918 RepID=A0AAJ0AD28_9PEZI|nr:G protein-coupled glucose receptor regulating Gpa2-domain-containing protein [Colletotrichum godetiae]KAK1671592.1 G protein-coupled glucose receptor regulating Gpa2-domain-containing protein [Colletotrichum godetiae]